MKDSLIVGLRYQHSFVVSRAKTVPAIYPESADFLGMPEVFATGYLVGFLEWACILAIKPHLDAPQEQTVGTHINVSHLAATPVGMTVTATVASFTSVKNGVLTRARSETGSPGATREGEAMISNGAGASSTIQRTN